MMAWAEEEEEEEEEVLLQARTYVVAAGEG
jgi:hypothetical protein